jgi:ATP-binding cassette subfamily B protein
MVCKYYGKEFSQSYLRDKCFTGKSGTSLLCLTDGAKEVGIQTAGVRITFEKLLSISKFPCFIQWKKIHLVVLYAIKNNKILIGDPGAGILKYKLDTFKRCWLTSQNKNGEDVGIVVFAQPTEKFYNQEEISSNSKYNFTNLLKYLIPHKSGLFKLAIAILLGSILSLIFPFLTQLIVDFGIENRSINFVLAILLGQLSIMLGIGATNFLSSWLVLHMSTRVGIKLVDDFLTKLMTLPINFFNKRTIGDLLLRIVDFSRIETFLTTSIISIIMTLISFFVYSFILFGYGKKLLLVFILGSIGYIAWVLLFMKKRKKIDYMRFQESANNQSNLIQIINGMQEIKLNNSEQFKKRDWQDIQVNLYNINIKGLTLAQTQDIGGELIDQLKNIFISFIAASAVINGEMTLGMMMAIQFIIGQMNVPLTQIISFLKAAQDTQISLERVNEINMKDDEIQQNEGKIEEIPISSNIIVSNVNFHYNGIRSAKILDNITLEIPANKVTAIVGTSGSGKTTLINLLLGSYETTSGSIMLGNKLLSGYNIRIWREYCGAVMQEGFIFTDTIAKNIALCEKEPDMKNVISACKTAALDTFVNSLPLGYKTLIGPDGMNLSTGQKQRILIARAVYKNAPYLFLDEATNSLDANNEKIIMQNLSGFYEGRTVIVVAHRLSTVVNADNIVVIDKGKIVEQGNHIDLTNKKGYYYNLVKNQLELGQ